jgi:hypothetical protein
MAVCLYSFPDKLCRRTAVLAGQLQETSPADRPLPSRRHNPATQFGPLEGRLLKLRKTPAGNSPLLRHDIACYFNNEQEWYYV